MDKMSIYYKNEAIEHNKCSRSSKKKDLKELIEVEEIKFETFNKGE
ncbi:MAG: hypothetical protein ACFE9Z_07195 [Promethearchaeota archaeon]